MTSQYKKIEQNTITRELLALTGGVAPLILSQPSFKERPNFLEKASRWYILPKNEFIIYKGVG
jgi:hypothetical protein